MKTLSLITVAFILLIGSVGSRAANVDRISTETGVDVPTLQSERASTGLGWGGLEKAHLLATASGQSFDTIVGKFQGHEGWGQIAHDYGLNLGKVVSGARRSSQATAHAQNTQTVHGKSSSVHGKSAHTQNTHHMSNTAFSRSHAGKVGHGSFGFSSRGGSHMTSHGTSHGMGGMGHGHSGH